MNRLLLSVAVVGVSLAVGGPALAHEHGGRPSMGHHESFRHDDFRDYHLRYGFKLRSGGYYFKGREHRFWSEYRFDSRYGCNVYWCPSTSCYYYWCEPDECYYPVDYCPYRKYCW
jgi:hypothetical protein